MFSKLQPTQTGSGTGDKKSEKVGMWRTILSARYVTDFMFMVSNGPSMKFINDVVDFYNKKETDTPPFEDTDINLNNPTSNITVGHTKAADTKIDDTNIASIQVTSTQVTNTQVTSTQVTSTHTAIPVYAVTAVYASDIYNIAIPTTHIELVKSTLHTNVFRVRHRHFMNNLISVNATASELSEILESLEYRDQIFTVGSVHSIVGKHGDLIEAMYRFGAEFIGYQIVSKKKIQLGLIETYGKRADFRYVRTIDQLGIYSNIPDVIRRDISTSWLTVLMSSIIRDLGDVFTVLDITNEAGINMLDMLIYTA